MAISLKQIVKIIFWLGSKFDLRKREKNRSIKCQVLPRATFVLELGISLLKNIKWLPGEYSPAFSAS